MGIPFGMSSRLWFACTALAALVGTARGQGSPPAAESGGQQKTLEERVKELEDKLANPDLSKFSAPDSFRAYWKDGLKLETNDKSIQLKFGMRIHFDSEWNHTDDDLEASKKFVSAGNTGTATTIGPFEDNWEIRRARIYVAGTMYDHVEFKAQYDFAKGAAQDKDVYVGAYDLGDWWMPNVRAGHMFEPFGLETLTSDNDLTFIEFDPGQENLAPFRNPGFLLWNNFKVDKTPRVTWWAGVFRTDTSDNAVGTGGDGGYNYDARITGTPLWMDDGNEMIHVGLAATHREFTRANGHSVTLSSKPGSDMLPTVISTGAIPADFETKYDAEFCTIWGPLTVQSEYLLDRVNTSAGSNLTSSTFHSWYGQASWTLTGETRRWNAVDAIPSTPRPSNNAFVNGGMGAWEVAARYSRLDLTDGSVASSGIPGGNMGIWTAGLTWYVNPNARVMWNLSHTDVNVDESALGKGGQSNIFEMRLQINF